MIKKYLIAACVAAFLVWVGAAEAFEASFPRSHSTQITAVCRYTNPVASQHLSIIITLSGKPNESPIISKLEITGQPAQFPRRAAKRILDDLRMILGKGYIPGGVLVTCLGAEPEFQLTLPLMGPTGERGAFDYLVSWDPATSESVSATIRSRDKYITVDEFVK